MKWTFINKLAYPFIKLFQRITEQTMSTNKLKKYLLHSIEELPLIIIGIIVALQINNWNENRKIEILKTAYLKSLVNDLDMDISMLDFGRGMIIKDSLELNLLVTRMNKPESNYDTLLKIARFEYEPNGVTIAGYYDITYKALSNQGYLNMFDPWLINKLMTIDKLHDESLVIWETGMSGYSYSYRTYCQKYSLKTDHNFNKEYYNIIWNDINKRDFIAEFNFLLSRNSDFNYWNLFYINLLKKETKILRDSICQRYNIKN